MNYPTGSQGGILPGQPQPGQGQQAGPAQQGGAQAGAGQPAGSRPIGNQPVGSQAIGNQPLGSQPSAARAPQTPGGPAFAGMSLPALLAAGTALFSLVVFFCSFPAGATPVAQESMYLLAGGLLAAIYLLPKAPKVLPAATVLSVVGGLAMLLAVVHATAATGIMIVLLILGLLQLLLSVAALLFDLDVVKLPAPKPAAPAEQQRQDPQQGTYAPTGVYPPAGGYPQQARQPAGAPQQNQPQNQQGQQNQQNQQNQQGQQGQQQGAAQTMYAPKQGQFSQQPPPPSTPPGGFSQPPQ